MTLGRRRDGTPSARSAVVVLADPDPDSIEADACASVVRGLERGGYHVDVLDLHALGFVAAMSRAERLAYVTDQPILDPMVADHAALVGAARTIVFVYPTIVWGMPAILKGWFERVLVSGVAFTLDPKSGRFRPGLKRLRRIVGVSTYRSSRAEVRLFNDAGRRLIRRGIRMSAPRARTQWHGLYDVERLASDRHERTAFLERLETAMAR